MKHEEGRIQYEICQWLQAKGIYFFSIPNEATGRTALQQSRLVAMGLRAGVSDLVVVLPGRVVFLEVKAPDGKQSPKQKMFEDKVTGFGHDYFIVRSVEDVSKILDT